MLAQCAFPFLSLSSLHCWHSFFGRSRRVWLFFFLNMARPAMRLPPSLGDTTHTSPIIMPTHALTTQPTPFSIKSAHQKQIMRRPRPPRVLLGIGFPFLLLLVGLGFLSKPTAGVDFRDVALAGLANIPELDVNAVTRGIGKITCVRSAA